MALQPHIVAPFRYSRDFEMYMSSPSGAAAPVCTVPVVIATLPLLLFGELRRLHTHASKARDDVVELTPHGWGFVLHVFRL